MGLRLRRPPPRSRRPRTSLQQYGEAQPGLDQYAINKFGLALEVVPRTLAENAGLDATNIIAAMYAEHKAGRGGVGIDVGGSGTAEICVAPVDQNLCHTFKVSSGSYPHEVGWSIVGFV